MDIEILVETVDGLVVYTIKFCHETFFVSSDHRIARYLESGRTEELVTLLLDNDGNLDSGIA